MNSLKVLWIDIDNDMSKMKNQRIYKTCAFVVILLALWYFLININSGTELAISAFSCVNPQEDKCMILVGPPWVSHRRPAPAAGCDFVLLCLNEKHSLNEYDYVQVEDKFFRDMEWNPSKNYSQLYFSTFKDIVSDSGGKLKMIDTTSGKNVVTTISQSDVFPNIVSCFTFSPDGKTLVGLTPPRGAGDSVNQGELAVSYDGGKSSVLTGIPMLGNPVWINNEELYLRTDSDTIVKIVLDNTNFNITDKLVENEGLIWLNGSFCGKVVYVIISDEGVRQLFVGDEMIYQASGLPYRVFVFENYIVLEADKKLLIFNESFSLCHEKKLHANMHVLNFIERTNSVLIVKDWTTILCYDFTKQEKPSVLFSVGMISD